MYQPLRIDAALGIKDGMEKLLLFFLLFLQWSCQPSGTVQCVDNSSCNSVTGGQCLKNPTTGNQWCAYPDDGCLTGARWSSHDVGDGLGGLCVGSASLRDGGEPDATLPDGNVSCLPRVAFHDGPYSIASGGKREVYVSNLDGTGLVNVSNSSAFDDYRASWSPDGTRVAFQSNRSGNWDIIVVRADGSGLRNLTEGSVAQEEQPVWSPDGKKIAYTANSALWVMTLDGLAPTPLTTIAVSNSIVWAPDSSKILFGSTVGNLQDLFVVSATGGAQPANVTNTATISEAAISWDPNARIVFDANGDVVTADFSGANKLNVTNSADYDVSPMWSPDGSIYFSSTKGGGQFELWKIAAIGGVSAPVTDNSLTEVGQGDFVNDVSANGQKIAFSRFQSPTSAQIGVVKSDGTGEILFSAGGNNAREPRFAKCQ
jgi:Tol biopolymer transport system component